jgi:hypothetical protein
LAKSHKVLLNINLKVQVEPLFTKTKFKVVFKRAKKKRKKSNKKGFFLISLKELFLSILLPIFLTIIGIILS